MNRRFYIRLIWPSFLVAAMAAAIIFTFMAPEDVVLFGNSVEASSTAIYTVGFFVLWAVSALSSALTMLTLPKEMIDAEEDSELT